MAVTKFNKYQKEILSDYAIAAGEVNPLGLYTKNIPRFTLDLIGNANVLKLIRRYYKGENSLIVDAEEVWNDYKQQSGTYFGSDTAVAAVRDDDIDKFWKLASNHYPPNSTELFRKLCNGYCGQGASERLNKLVKKVRNKLRNRQSHVTTQAHCLLDSYYKQDQLFQQSSKANKRFLDHIKNKFKKIQEVAVLDRELERQESENLVADIQAIIPENAIVDSSSNLEANPIHVPHRVITLTYEGVSVRVGTQEVMLPAEEDEDENMEEDIYINLMTESDYTDNIEEDDEIGEVIPAEVVEV
jgi:hypothetical protein